MEYEIKQEVLSIHPQSIDLNEAGKPVNLMGFDVTVEIAGTADAPPTKRTAKGATQEDLAFFFRKGHPFVAKSNKQVSSK